MLRKIDLKDFGWIIISIGMAIGSGIIFLPIQVGIAGFYPFIVAALLGYPAIYLIQKYFLNILMDPKDMQDFPNIISQHLGKNAGLILGIVYFLMMLQGLLNYSTAIVNDSASYLQSFHISEENLNNSNIFYSLIIIFVLIMLSIQGEKFITKVITPLIFIKVSIIALLGISMIAFWKFSNITLNPSIFHFIKGVIMTLPFTITSILFIQTLSPMAISYAKTYEDRKIAKNKCFRVHNIAFWILFIVVFFYAFSFVLGVSHADAEIAHKENISSLALVAKLFNSEYFSQIVKFLAVALEIFAILSAFFGQFLSYEEGIRGIIFNILSRFIKKEKIPTKTIGIVILILSILFIWGFVKLNISIIFLSRIFGSLLAILGCFLPIIVIYKVPTLQKYRGIGAIYVFLIGILLFINPFL